MTTSATAGVAKKATSKKPPAETPAPEPPVKIDHPPTVYIVGFAPSWQETPWGAENADFWGMNALHKLTADKPWTHWFQLHDVDAHHAIDKEEHVAWLAQCGLPVFMFEEHMAGYNIPNGVPYPREQILAHFGNYFTNTVSWQVAMAIALGYKKIGIYGVDMAQDSEYGSQRPSCEWIIGWAQGVGIEVDLPGSSDLMKTPFLYGVEDGSIMRQKYDARMKELIERRNELERQRNASHEAFLQVIGAIENTEYFRRVWSQEEIKST